MQHALSDAMLRACCSFVGTMWLLWYSIHFLTCYRGSFPSICKLYSNICFSSLLFSPPTFYLLIDIYRGLLLVASSGSFLRPIYFKDDTLCKTATTHFLSRARGDLIILLVRVSATDLDFMMLATLSFVSPRVNYRHIFHVTCLTLTNWTISLFPVLCHALLLTARLHSLRHLEYDQTRRPTFWEWTICWCGLDRGNQ